MAPPMFCGICHLVAAVLFMNSWKRFRFLLRFLARCFFDNKGARGAYRIASMEEATANRELLDAREFSFAR